MPHFVDLSLTRHLQYLLLNCVLLAELLATESIPKLGPKKRGGGWGYTAQNVSGELEAMPVQWWYNWGNGIPDPAAQAVTEVTSSPPIYAETFRMFLGPLSFVLASV